MDCLSHLSSLLNVLSGTPSLSLPSSSATTETYDVLCLGSGWTYTFLSPAAANKDLKVAFTSRTSKPDGFVFNFDPDSDDIEPFKALPNAKAIVIIFPLYSKDAVKRLVGGYLKSRQQEEGSEKAITPHFILLGSTGIWDHGPTLQFAPLSDGRVVEKVELDISRKKHKSNSVWKDRHSEVQPLPRALAEDALLSLNMKDNMVQEDSIPTAVLCLSGLWGHGRSPRRYISVIAPTKERLAKLGSVHLIHGHDVARAILAMIERWDKAEAQRWLLTNERVYDLWDLCSRWGDGGEAGRDHPPTGSCPRWVQELIAESRQKKGDANEQVKTSPIRSLPRTVEQMGSALDGTDFWSTFGLAPDVPWVD